MEFDSYYSSVLKEMMFRSLLQDNRKWIYCGVFLDDESKKILMQKVLDWFPNQKSNFDSWKWYCDHITLVFNNIKNPDPSAQAYGEQIIENDIGKPVDITVVGVGATCASGFGEKDIIAVKVELDPVSGIKSLNEQPHITCIAKPGVKPVMSNRISKWTPLIAKVGDRGDKRLERFRLRGEVHAILPNNVKL